jgi:hypothetical protein
MTSPTVLLGTIHSCYSVRLNYALQGVSWWSQGQQENVPLQSVSGSVFGPQSMAAVPLVSQSISLMPFLVSHLLPSSPMGPELAHN